MYYWGKKYSIFDLFPLTYICVDNDFRLFSDWESEKIHLRQKKLHVAVMKLAAGDQWLTNIPTTLMATSKVRLVW